VRVRAHIVVGVQRSHGRAVPQRQRVPALGERVAGVSEALFLCLLAVLGTSSGVRGRIRRAVGE
jgi:hypothetical protein